MWLASALRDRNPLNMFTYQHPSKEMDEHSTVSKHADTDKFWHTQDCTYGTTLGHVEVRAQMHEAVSVTGGCCRVWRRGGNMRDKQMMREGNNDNSCQQFMRHESRFVLMVANRKKHTWLAWRNQCPFAPVWIKDESCKHLNHQPNNDLLVFTPA